jgi:hypothetical protein
VLDQLLDIAPMHYNGWWYLGLDLNAVNDEAPDAT